MEITNNLVQKAKELADKSKQQETIPNQTINKTSNSNQQINTKDFNNFFVRFYLDFYDKGAVLSEATFKQWLSIEECSSKGDRELILRGDLLNGDNEFIKKYKELLENNSQIDKDEANGYFENTPPRFTKPKSTEFAKNFIDGFLIKLYNGSPQNPQSAKSELLGSYPKLEENLELLDLVYQYARRDSGDKFNDFINNYKQKPLSNELKEVSTLNNNNNGEIIFQNVDKKEDLLKATIFTEYRLSLEENVLEKIKQYCELSNNGDIYNSQNNEGKTLQLIDINPKTQPLEILKDYKLLQIKYQNDKDYNFYLVKQKEDGTIYYPTIKDGREIVEQLTVKPSTEQNNTDLLKTAIFGGLNSEINFVTIDARDDYEEDLPTTVADLRDCDFGDDTINTINTINTIKTTASKEKIFANAVKEQSLQNQVQSDNQTIANTNKIDTNAIKKEENIPQNQVQPKSFFAKLCDLFSCRNDNNVIR